MIAAVRNATSMLGLSLEEAVGIASHAPAAFLGLADERGSIATGQAADLVLLDDDLRVRETWIGGIASAA
jgi:N-acetylglucosamine-6-phosphate deacetylase